MPDLILLVTSSTLESILCSNYNTTAQEHFAALLGALSSHHRALMSMIQSPISLIIENTALILHVISTQSPDTARAIREDSLSSAVILHHFHSAVFSPLEGQRFLSRYLCSLWFSGPPDCQEKRLLRRMIPNGFMAYLKMPRLSQAEEDQLDDLEQGGIEASSTTTLRFVLETGGGTNTKRLRSRISIAVSAGTTDSQPENFRIFFPCHDQGPRSSGPDMEPANPQGTSHCARDRASIHPSRNGGAWRSRQNCMESSAIYRPISKSTG